MPTDPDKLRIQRREGLVMVLEREHITAVRRFIAREAKYGPGGERWRYLRDEMLARKADLDSEREALRNG